MRVSLTRLPLRRHVTRPVVLGAAVAALIGGAAIAYAFFSSSRSGSSSSSALTVRAGHQPTVSASGSSVTVSWPPAPLADGTPVAGYLSHWYHSGGAAQTVTAGRRGP